MQVVVVDDEELIVRGLCEMIRSTGFANVEARGFDDSGEARLHLLAHPADLIFMDINMPGTDGIGLIEEVRETQRESRFVILSGYQEFAYAQQAIRLGVSEYLVKPIDPADLERILRRAFQDAHRMSPEEYAGIAPAGLEMFDLDRASFSRQLQRLLDYIDEHLLCDVSLSALSEFGGLHPNYISSLFMKEMGVNYMTYIHGLKLRRALEMLEADREAPITSIALQLGYYSERQFYRMFKRFMGITPGQYRENGYKL